MTGLTKSTTTVLVSAPAMSLDAFAFTTDRFEGGSLELASMPAPAIADRLTILPH